MPQSTLTFITESLPEFYVNTPANFQIEAVGGAPPYTFQITQGALPPVLKLSKAGKITGTPRRVADTTVFVKLSDTAGAHLTQAFAVRVAPPQRPSVKLPLKRATVTRPPTKKLGSKKSPSTKSASKKSASKARAGRR